MQTEKRINLDDVRIPSLAEIEAAPTQHVGQFADLKLEEYANYADGSGFCLVRYWLNRTGPEDGETHKVDVEARECPNGAWADVGKLYAFDRDLRPINPPLREGQTVQCSVCGKMVSDAMADYAVEPFTFVCGACVEERKRRWED